MSHHGKFLHETAAWRSSWTAQFGGKTRQCSYPLALATVELIGPSQDQETSHARCGDFQTIQHADVPTYIFQSECDIIFLSSPEDLLQPMVILDSFPMYHQVVLYLCNTRNISKHLPQDLLAFCFSWWDALHQSLKSIEAKRSYEYKELWRLLVHL